MPLDAVASEKMDLFSVIRDRESYFLASADCAISRVWPAGISLKVSMAPSGQVISMLSMRVEVPSPKCSTGSTEDRYPR